MQPKNLMAKSLTPTWPRADLRVPCAIVLFFFFRDTRQGHDAFAVFEFDQTHALGVAADDADILDAQTNDLADVGDQHELVFFVDLLHADDAASAFAGLHRDDALAAARLQPVFVHLGAFAVAAVSNRQDA